jgi:hypothetical protein
MYFHAAGTSECATTAYVKPLAITPSDSAHLINDMYRSVEKFPAQLKLMDGTHKPFLHMRTDGGSNESKDTYVNQIYWTEYMERNRLEQFLLTHRESGGNVLEFIERVNGHITSETAGWLVRDHEYEIVDKDTGESTVAWIRLSR